MTQLETRATSNITTTFSRSEIDLIKSTICKGSTDNELRLFINAAQSWGLNPFAKQIFAVKRWDSKERREVMSIQVSIDGLRVMAERTGLYLGQLGPYYSAGEVLTDEKTSSREIVWYDGWPFEDAPKIAKVGVLRRDFAQPLWAQAKLSSYAQTNKDGALNPMWKKMPEIMLAKCAESLALRKAFPQQLSGAYTTDEMGASHSQERPARPVVAATSEVDKLERLEKMLIAFCFLYESQTGKKAGSIRYALEDICGGKRAEEFDDTDFKALQWIYHDLNSGKMNWDQVLKTSPDAPAEMPAEQSPEPEIDANLAVQQEAELAQL